MNYFAVNLITDHNNAVAFAYLADPLQLLTGPYPARWIMRITKQQNTVLGLCGQSLQAVKVNFKIITVR